MSCLNPDRDVVHPDWFCWDSSKTDYIKEPIKRVEILYKRFLFWKILCGVRVIDHRSESFTSF